MTLPADEFDALLFAETHFAQANGYFRRGGKLFDANSGPDRDATQRTQQRLRTIAGYRNGVTHVGRKLGELRLSCKRVSGRNSIGPRLKSAVDGSKDLSDNSRSRRISKTNSGNFPIAIHNSGRYKGFVPDITVMHTITYILPPSTASVPIPPSATTHEHQTKK